MLFLDISVGMLGRIHDTRVLRNSLVYEQITSEALIPEEFHILGDSAYLIMSNVDEFFNNNENDDVASEEQRNVGIQKRD